MERVVCVRSRGSARVASSRSLAILGRRRLPHLLVVRSLSPYQSHTRGGGNDVSRHTHDLAKERISGQIGVRKKGETRSSLSPRHHLDQLRLTRRPEPCHSTGQRDRSTQVPASSREDGNPEAPRVVPGHTRRSQRDVEVLQQRAERIAQKRADRTAAAARRLSVSRSGARPRAAVVQVETNTTLFGQEVTKVSSGRRSGSAPRRRSNHSGSRSRSVSVFFFCGASGRVEESPREMERKVPWLSNCRLAPSRVLTPPSSGTQGVSVNGSAEFQRNGMSRGDTRSLNRGRLSGSSQ